ncbi:MAG TPA: ABC transporter substrate-binding protein [Vineibacter sp.]|nr:ABC transporter substrate-binding protein [Vineibacter sp.]
MRRRVVLAAIGAAIAVRPHAGAAQGTVRRVGGLVVDGGEGFRERLAGALRTYRYIEGQNLRLDVRSAEGNPGRLPALAAELVRLRVELVVARLTPAVSAVQQATRDIPIVMAGAGDPVGSGLVASLARPGGNVTGVAGAAAQLTGKMLEIVRDMMPSLRTVAVLANAADPFTAAFLGEIRRASMALAIETSVHMIGGADELAPVFAGLVVERPDAIVVQPSLPRRIAAELALAHRLPILSPIGAFAAEGGLLAYSSNQTELYEQVALYVDKILKGSKPADLPVSQSARFDLALNLRTARAIGMSISPAILARANELID